MTDDPVCVDGDRSPAGLRLRQEEKRALGDLARRIDRDTVQE
jgi:hypothetical protein